MDYYVTKLNNQNQIDNSSASKWECMRSWWLLWQIDQMNTANWICITDTVSEHDVLVSLSAYFISLFVIMMRHIHLKGNLVFSLLIVIWNHTMQPHTYAFKFESKAPLCKRGLPATINRVNNVDIYYWAVHIWSLDKATMYRHAQTQTQWSACVNIPCAQGLSFLSGQMISAFLQKILW